MPTDPIRAAAAKRAWDKRGRVSPERFWALVDKEGAPPAHQPELGPCWLWTGMKNAQGYGFYSSRIVQNPDGIRRSASHRIAYELVKGPIPSGLVLCHACDVPLCVNPGHLWPGTQKENMRDASRKGRLRVERRNEAVRFKSGEAHPRSVLTEIQVREIRRLHAKGITIGSIARLLGTRTNRIHLITSGQRWAHVHP